MKQWNRLAALAGVVLTMVCGAVDCARAQCTQQLWAPDGVTDDMFGATVSAWGEFTVVGARIHNDAAGAAYVYRRAGDLWVFETELQASDGKPGDRFGSSVAIHADVILVGAFMAEIGTLAEAGAAYVFRWNGSEWREEAKLEASDPDDDDRFGDDVAAGPDFLAVGAHRDDEAGFNRGAAYVFREVGGTWAEEAKLLPSAGVDRQAFGHGISILDQRIFVGAPQEYRTNSDTGSVYVFRNDGGTWLEEARLLASDGAIGDEFGTKLCADGDRLAVGARFDNGGGSCYTFRWDGTAWVEEAKVRPGDGGGWYGMAVGLRGDRLAVGAIFNASSGSAYLYDWDGQDWRNETKLHPSGLPSGSRFGHSISMLDDQFVVGAPMRGSSDIGVGPGTAFVYGVCDWTWRNYGDGWPGTKGVPELTADTSLPPQLSITIGNSFGPPTIGFLLWGLSTANIATPWDGEIYLYLEGPITPFLIPVSGLTLTASLEVPPVAEFCLQVLELDLGASCGVSFTQGLIIEF